MITARGTVRSKHDSLTPDFSAENTNNATLSLANGINAKIPDRRDCSICLSIDGPGFNSITVPVTPGQLAEIAVGQTFKIVLEPS